jgi:peptidoglycan/LPS O-acetylase OafA/YrhL
MHGKSSKSCPYRPFGTLRFLLAVLVMIQHFGSNIVPEPLRAAIYPLAVGTVAVMVFFVLSGFIIAEAVHYNYQTRPGAFLFNRFLRIVPPLAIAMTLSVGVHFVLMQQGMLVDLEGHPRGAEIFTASGLGMNYLSFLPGLREAGLLPEYSFFPYIWAIRAEVLFYFAMVAALVAAAVLRRTGGVAARLSVWLTLAGAGGLVLAAGSIAGKLPDLLAFGPYFVLGAALFYWVNGRRAAALFVPVCLVLMGLHYQDTHAGKVLAYPQDMAFQFGLLAVLVTAVAVCAVARLKSRRLLVLDRFLGEMSFPLYLYHYPVGIVFASLFAGAHSGLTALSAGAVSCIAAVAMYYPVEPLLRRARNRVRGRALDLDVSVASGLAGQAQRAAA